MYFKIYFLLKKKTNFFLIKFLWISRIKVRRQLVFFFNKKYILKYIIKLRYLKNYYQTHKIYWLNDLLINKIIYYVFQDILFIKKKNQLSPHFYSTDSQKFYHRFYHIFVCFVQIVLLFFLYILILFIVL
jgi:hypothetical protein